MTPPRIIGESTELRNGVEFKVTTYAPKKGTVKRGASLKGQCGTPRRDRVLNNDGTRVTIRRRKRMSKKARLAAQIREDQRFQYIAKDGTRARPNVY